MQKFTFNILLISLVLGAACLSACNTFEGAGEDIEVAGENIQQASQNAKQ